MRLALFGIRSPLNSRLHHTSEAWRSSGLEPLVPIKTAQDVYRQLAFLLGKADA
jgi:hypothetical protein